MPWSFGSLEIGSFPGLDDSGFAVFLAGNSEPPQELAILAGENLLLTALPCLKMKKLRDYFILRQVFARKPLFCCLKMEKWAVISILRQPVLRDRSFLLPGRKTSEFVSRLTPRTTYLCLFLAGAGRGYAER
ncbi:MAG: hypothetical protein IK009_03065 [Bacteroidales bacterium]|nr:hypothetical protein [Bacteroidales bacterium]